MKNYRYCQEISCQRKAAVLHGLQVHIWGTHVKLWLIITSFNCKENIVRKFGGVEVSNPIGWWIPMSPTDAWQGNAKVRVILITIFTYPHSMSLSPSHECGTGEQLTWCWVECKAPSFGRVPDDAVKVGRLQYIIYWSGGLWHFVYSSIVWRYLSA